MIFALSLWKSFLRDRYERVPIDQRPGEPSPMGDDVVIRFLGRLREIDFKN